jgi:hypothetical protein
MYIRPKSLVLLRELSLGKWERKLFWNYTTLNFAYIFVWVRKLDIDSLTETKNWGGGNEAIETSGRLHPLWPQNKRLHSPRTTDRLHTRQGRWIQKELAFTPAENATKPNPFKIIPLQSKGKKNNWETEETMERATVTLEMERVKWPNPGCLWWFWWPKSCWLLACSLQNKLRQRRSQLEMQFTICIYWHCWKYSWNPQCILCSKHLLRTVLRAANWRTFWHESTESWYEKKERLSKSSLLNSTGQFAQTDEAAAEAS